MVLTTLLAATPAMATEPATNWQLGLPAPATPLSHMIYNLHDLLLVIMTGVAVFVLVLLLYVMLRFNARRNPVPSKTTHHTLLEVVWTAIPVLILVCIAVPSFHLLYSEDSVPEADLSLKVTGYQWYWGYEYPDNNGLSFDSNMLRGEELDPAKGQLRLLSVDNPVVLPVGKTIRLYITAADVLHSWAMPAFGTKVDAVPGRLNETWVKIETPGHYYGQCSEICGEGHGFMPIEIIAVAPETFDVWVQVAQEDLEASYSYLETGATPTGFVFKPVPEETVEPETQASEVTADDTSTDTELTGPAIEALPADGPVVVEPVDVEPVAEPASEPAPDSSSPDQTN